MDAAREVAQLLKGELHLAVRLVDHLGRRVRVLQQLLLGQTEAHGQGHEPGLRAVVQVAFDPAQVGGGGLGDRRAVRLQLGDPPLQFVGGRQQAAHHHPVHVGQSARDPGQRGPEQEERGDRQREGQDRPRQPDERVQRVPPPDRVLQAQPQPGEETVPRGVQRAGLVHPYAQQTPCAGALQLPVLTAHQEPHREQRQSHDGDGQPDARHQPDGQYGEGQDAQREIGEEVDDFPPGRGGQRGPGRRQGIATVGAVAVTDGARRRCGPSGEVIVASVVSGRCGHTP